ncbi:MAG: serine/threonine-protein kinase [Polyangiaceae bacterium]
MDTEPADTPPPPSSSFAAGRLLGGKYRLIRRVGEGAMGEVWAAVNVALDLPVALKLIHRRARHPELLRRLLREGQAAAKLTHPGVVRVYDFGETDGEDPYIVMERLEGEDLRQLLEARGHLSVEEAVRTMLPVAAALHAAHLRGVVHRDLKPDNVFMSRDHAGRVQPKILDFGIAKLVWIEAEQQAAEEQVVGTPEYMAPEQAFEPEEADHRVDVWGFCSVLYELIAGHAPLPSRGMLDAMRAALQDAAPSLLEAGLADEPLWAIIDRGLNKDPAQRWRSMQDCGEALAQWAAARGVVEDITGATLNSDWSVVTERHSHPGTHATPEAEKRRTLPGGLAPPGRGADEDEDDDDPTLRDGAVGTTTSEPPAYQPTASDRGSDPPLSQTPLSAPGKRARMIGAFVVGVGALALLIAWLALPKGDDAPPRRQPPWSPDGCPRCRRPRRRRSPSLPRRRPGADAGAHGHRCRDERAKGCVAGCEAEHARDAGAQGRGQEERRPGAGGCTGGCRVGTCTGQRAGAVDPAARGDRCRGRAAGGPSRAAGGCQRSAGPRAACARSGGAERGACCSCSCSCSCSCARGRRDRRWRRGALGRARRSRGPGRRGGPLAGWLSWDRVVSAGARVSCGGWRGEETLRRSLRVLLRRMGGRRCVGRRRWRCGWRRPRGP